MLILLLSNIFEHIYNTIKLIKLIILLLLNLSQTITLANLLIYYFSLLLKAIYYN